MISSEASPTIWSCYANLNCYHHSFLYKLIPFVIYKNRKICIAWLNCRAGFATVNDDPNIVKLYNYNKLLNNYWMRSSRIWGIIKAEVCVICRSRRLRQITQTEALIIPHILRELNSIIVLLFTCTCEPFPWRSHLYFEFWHKQHKPFVFCIWHKQHKLVWRHNVV